VDAGVLKRVLLADGAVVSVQGAREVSLSRPLQLPLPLATGGPEGGLAASLVALAARLRSASRGEEKPLLSLMRGHDPGRGPGRNRRLALHRCCCTVRRLTLCTHS
jgi:hypothetical protein